jgi:hypothetical protein
MQSVHITKRVSAYHLACNSIKVIILFRNVGMSSRVDDTRAAVTLIDIDECWCLLHSIAMEDLMKFETSLEAEQGLNSLVDSLSLESFPV